MVALCQQREDDERDDEKFTVDRKMLYIGRVKIFYAGDAIVLILLIAIGPIPISGHRSHWRTLERAHRGVATHRKGLILR